jgi:hypothetical protein
MKMKPGQARVYHKQHFPKSPSDVEFDETIKSERRQRKWEKFVLEFLPDHCKRELAFSFNFHEYEAAERAAQRLAHTRGREDARRPDR